MPVIRNYRSRVATPGPAARSNLKASPANFGAMEAGAREKLAGAVSKTGNLLTKRMEQEETSQANAAMAKFQAQKQAELQEVVKKAEPGDSKVFEDFDARMKEDLLEVGNQFSTSAAKQYYAGAAARIQGHILKSSSSALAESKATKGVLDYKDTINGLSASLMADPTSYELQKDLLHAGVENLRESDLLPANKVAELRADGNGALAKSAVRGWIKLDPEYAKEKLDGGVFDKDMGAEVKRQMYGEADQAIRAREAEEARRRQRAKELKKEKDNITQNGFLTKLVDGELTSDDILTSDLPSFGSGSKDQFIKMIKTRNSGAGKSNPAVVAELFRRIHLPVEDPDHIGNENAINDYFGSGVGKDDLGWLRKEIAGMNSPEQKRTIKLKENFLNNVAKSQIAKSSFFSGKDPAGEAKFQQFMTDFHQKYAEEVANGKNPDDLVNPSSKDYLGWMIPQYTRTIQEVIRDRSNRIRGNSLTGTAENAGAANAAPKYNSIEEYEKVKNQKAGGK